MMVVRGKFEILADLARVLRFASYGVSVRNVDLVVVPRNCDLEALVQRPFVAVTKLLLEKLSK